MSSTGARDRPAVPGGKSYGMNFEVMPELGSRYGYFVILGLMFTIATGLLLGFRRNRWL